MAGYSGTPLAKKLGIKEGARVALLGPPDGLERALEPLPDGVRIGGRLARRLDIVLFFTRRRGELEHRLDRLARALDPAGGL